MESKRVFSWLMWINTEFPFMESLKGVPKVKKSQHGVCQGSFSIAYMGISKNRGTPKWMVYTGKPYEHMDDLGGFPIFLVQHPY